MRISVGAPAGGDGPSDVLVIGVCGGSASGKKSVCDKVLVEVKGACHTNGSVHPDRRLLVLSQAWFCKDGLSPETCGDVQNYGRDHPESLDVELLIFVLKKLKAREAVDIPTYDMVKGTRSKETVRFEPADVVIFEGIHTLFFPEVRDLLDMKYFIDVDSDVRLSNRVCRDVKRGRNLKQILTVYQKFTKPCFDQFIQPAMRFADLIIPRGADNLVAIKMIAKHILLVLSGRPILKYQSDYEEPASPVRPLPKGQAILPPTPH